MRVSRLPATPRPAALRSQVFERYAGGVKRVKARAGFLAVCAVLTLAAVYLSERGDVTHHSFKAFYCAGAAIDRGDDPYRVEPLRSCERRLTGSAPAEGYVEPAPLPGYALAGFALLAKLPVQPAAVLFGLLLVAAAALSAVFLSLCTGYSAAALLLALSPLTLLNVSFGEIPPLALLAVCAAAWLLKSRRFFAAGVATALTLIEPNVGLPAVAAVFLFCREARVAILSTGVALGAISLAVLGTAGNLEYAFSVLPLMSRAELPARDQYSLAHLLFSNRVPAELAIRAGAIWYAGVAAAGVTAAGTLAARRRSPEALALLPCAIAMLLGIYLHDIQILVAIPAAVWLTAQLPAGSRRALAVLAVALLAIVWTQRLERFWTAVDLAGCTAAVWAITSGSPVRRVTIAAAGALAALVLAASVRHAIVQPPYAAEATARFGASPTEPAAAAWGRYLSKTPALTVSAFTLKVPTWFGLLCVTLATFGLAITPIRPESRERPLASAPCNESLQRCG
jgi:hypothetical protein